MLLDIVPYTDGIVSRSTYRWLKVYHGFIVLLKATRATGVFGPHLIV